MRQFIIKEDVVNAVGNYLSARPWKEVNRLIELISKLEEIETPKKTEESREIKCKTS